jgi:aminotransferase
VPRVSAKSLQFTESVIREMTRLARKHDAINLAQGFPDFECPEEIKKAACDAIQSDVNQYAITWGAPSLREAVCEKAAWANGIEADPERNVTVCCGATEAMLSTLLALVDPGDEVVVFEPFYENYGPDTILCGATPRFVTLHEPDWSIDEAELRRAFGPRTKAIILNTPNNPTGEVFRREELALIAELCVEHGTIGITDEIYEHIVYDGEEHVALAALPGMEELSVTINALSKTYSVTGWRVGWAIASEELTSAIRKVHDFVTVGAAAPLQEAGARALRLPRSYYTEISRMYQGKRDRLLAALESIGFRVFAVKGAYYVMTDISEFGFDDDVLFGRFLAERVGVAGVPGSSFYVDPAHGRQRFRFNFCKKDRTLESAIARLSRIHEVLPGAAKG